MKILSFRDLFCPNYLRWMILIKRMHQLPRNMLQQSPISLKFTKVRVLNFGCTQPYLFLKGTNENHKFFQLSNLIAEVQCKGEPATAINYAEYFSRALKTAKEKKKNMRKIKALYCICLK